MVYNINMRPEVLGILFAVFFGLPTASYMRLGFVGIIVGMLVWFFFGIAIGNKLKKQ